jgi:large subunit ribosomal protein L19e
MTILTVRRLAADIMNVGKSRVKISPDGLKEAEGALTRSDVRGLIEKGVITKAKVKGRDSTARNKRKGAGRRKGSLGDKKKLWMQKVRAQRKLLAMLIEKGVLEKKSKRSLYGKVKSGIFRNKKAMLLYLKDNEYIAKDYEPEAKVDKADAAQKKKAAKKAKKIVKKKGSKKTSKKKPAPKKEKKEGESK